MNAMKLSRIGLLAAALFATIGATGCGGSTTVVAGGTTSFVVTNQSGEGICYVNLSPTSSSDWGPDQLGPSEIIQPGSQKSWSIPADYYDFRLQDCNHNTMMERRNVAISGTGIEITFRVRE